MSYEGVSVVCMQFRRPRWPGMQSYKLNEARKVSYRCFPHSLNKAAVAAVYRRRGCMHAASKMFKRIASPRLRALTELALTGEVQLPMPAFFARDRR